MVFSFKESFQHTMALSLYFITAKYSDIFVLYLSIYLEKYLNQELKSYSTPTATSSQCVVRMMMASTGSPCLAPEASLCV